MSTSSEFTQSDSRYYRGEPATNEQMVEAKSSVGAAMDRLFGVRKYQDGGDQSGLLMDVISHGQESTEMTPSESPAWRRRIEKARREITEHAAEIRVKELAESITFEELQNDLREIRKWANSLRKTI